MSDDAFSSQEAKGECTDADLAALGRIFLRGIQTGERTDPRILERMNAAFEDRGVQRHAPTVFDIPETKSQAEEEADSKRLRDDLFEARKPEFEAIKSPEDEHKFWIGFEAEVLKAKLEAVAAEQEAHLAEHQVQKSYDDSMLAALDDPAFSISSFGESYDESRAMAMRNRDAFHAARAESRPSADIEGFERTEDGDVVHRSRSVKVPVARRQFVSLLDPSSRIRRAQNSSAVAVASSVKLRGRSRAARCAAAKAGGSRRGSGSRGDPDDPDPPASSGTPPARRLTSGDRLAEGRWASTTPTGGPAA